MSDETLLCSFREAARVLGVGRNSTLPGLIQRGALKPVTIAGRQYIPREQLVALARNGEGQSPSGAETPLKRKRTRGSTRSATPRLQDWKP